MKNSNQTISSFYLSGIIVILLMLIIIPTSAFGQSDNDRPAQTIRGVITDAASGETIPFASVSLAECSEKGVVSDENGHFSIMQVPVGRHTVKVSYMGYEPVVIKVPMFEIGKDG